MKKLLILPMIVLLSACVSAPPGLERDEFTIQSLKKIEADDYACKCKKVRLAGQVINAEALKGKTKVEVLSLPVSTYSAKPVIDSISDGRFIAYINGFIDPKALKDQYITVLGVLNTKHIGKIDEVDYHYPVVEVSAYKQWRLAEEYYYDYDDSWDDYFDHRWRWGPFWQHRYPELRVRYNLY
ncbi:MULTISPECIES: Slp family lipoprotein [Pasteurellaceae]|uniref:Outer membrane lipoprotein Slp family protein n=1 Tax=Pasteurella bettyae CCUG 2042 TaxID=1095749 RepID=I3DIB0_9PAST|nr:MULTISPECIES: Slp family lipoprotein [Pasteurellaceae]EIJ71453.1 outer membrane lipoprotein Slp family protein [Pasteurella bettyae CCUG 2042]SUB21537.1 outer membrane lipoprotein Slp family protein [Pasteurella bettyae]